MSPEQAASVAREAVEAAARVALEHFRTGVEVRTKADHSPVTVADLESERTILQLLGERDPGTPVLAEESGLVGEPDHRRWIVDPIDGTRGFARGGEYWGPLVAYEADGEVLAGALALPARGEVYWAARGHGAFKDGAQLRVSAVDRLGDATLSLGETTRLLRAPHGPAVRDLIDQVASTRGFGDLAAVTLVLEGRAELYLECGVKPWDLAPARILLEEAGGRFTTFAGDHDLMRGDAIGSNGRLHDEALGRLMPVAHR